MISPEMLHKRPGFARDLYVDSPQVPAWREGDILVKSNVLLAGSARKQPPQHPVRLLIFAEHASCAESKAADPWQLMAIDRPACFVVADVYEANDCTQYTLYEIDEDDLKHMDTAKLDARGHAAVHHTLDEACKAPADSYTTDPIFMRAVGIDQPIAVESLFERVDEKGAQTYLSTHRRAAVGTTSASPELEATDEQAAQDEALVGRSQAPDEPVAFDHAIYQQDDESWIVALAESILSESAAKSYMAADERSTQRAPGTAADAPEASAAASALYATLHEAPPATTTGGSPSAGTAAAPSTRPGTTQAAHAASALYETLHLAEARLEETPDYTDISVASGLKFFQATNRAQAAHPALEYVESQRNFERLLHRNLSGTLIGRLYQGDTAPVSDEERMAEARRLWFDPLSQNTSFPLLSTDIDSYIEGMRLQYAQFEHEGNEDPRMLEAAHAQLNMIDAALHGDIESSIELIKQDAAQLHLPYRFQFSVSFDMEQRQALINVFLPQKALFPLSMQSPAADGTYSASGFNQRYQGVACALGIMALYMVKMNAAWVQDVALNAWYRTEHDPVCVYSVRANEQALSEHTTKSTPQAFQTLKDLHARIHSGNHHELLALDPLFSLHEALDCPIGFKTYANGWTFPPVFTAITAEASAENLEKTISMLLDLIAQGSYTQAYEIAQKHEVLYRIAWLNKVDHDTQAISCETELEENLVLRMPSSHGRVVLPRKLGQLYHILGTLANDAGNTTAACTWLEKALSLNPAGALSFIEMAKIELAHGGIEGAEFLLDSAKKVATNSYALAQVAKYRAMIFALSHQPEMAYHLFSYAYHLHDSDAHREVCLAGIHELDLSAHTVRNPQRPASLETCLSYLREHGRQAGIADEILSLVEGPVEDAISGGPLPDASYVDAYLCSLHAAGRNVEAVRNLVLNVHTVRFRDFPFSDYLFKPILLCDSDIVYTIDQSLELAPNRASTSAGLLAIPYIDTHAGLTLQVLGTADINTQQPLRVLATPLRLSATPFADVPFKLLRAVDFPAFPIEATVNYLHRTFAPNQQLDATRARRDIDLLRDFGNPDNILVILTASNVRPEGVWATLEYADDEGTLYARLAVEPYDDFGIHSGDVRPLHIQPDPDNGLVLAFMR